MKSSKNIQDIFSFLSSESQEIRRVNHPEVAYKLCALQMVWDATRDAVRDNRIEVRCIISCIIIGFIVEI